MHTANAVYWQARRSYFHEIRGGTSSANLSPSAKFTVCLRKQTMAVKLMSPEKQYQKKKPRHKTRLGSHGTGETATRAYRECGILAGEEIFLPRNPWRHVIRKPLPERQIHSHALVSPPSHSRVLSPRYTRLGSLLACRMLCILGGFAAYKTTLSCFVLATTSLRSVRKARDRLSRHPSSEASIISQTKKPPEIGWFFVWLPLLGSNQRHHD